MHQITLSKSVSWRCAGLTLAALIALPLTSVIGGEPTMQSQILDVFPESVVQMPAAEHGQTVNGVRP